MAPPCARCYAVSTISVRLKVATPLPLLIIILLATTIALRDPPLRPNSVVYAAPSAARCGDVGMESG